MVGPATDYRAETTGGLSRRRRAHLHFARCACAGIVSYGPVRRLTPADNRRLLCSPEKMEASLCFATEGNVSADRC
jgi:hypothetical protein